MIWITSDEYERGNEYENEQKPNSKVRGREDVEAESLWPRSDQHWHVGGESRVLEKRFRTLRHEAHE